MSEALAIQPEDTEFVRTAALLGGVRVLRRRVASSLDAHDLIQDGLPSGALDHLVKSVGMLHSGSDAFERALGLSLRTYQRRKEDGAKPLNREQSGRTWKFAEVLARATDVLGSQAAAETWLDRPALGLEGRRPVELLSTPAGVEMVEDHLTRLEYGVYT
jgi:putative toxin-antitoxin system antitoxin component (TIGR02293 family)